jgi:hypothetical protein
VRWVRNDLIMAKGYRPPIPEGKHQVRIEFRYDGGGLTKGGDVTLYECTTVGTGRVGAAQPMIFSADETTHILRPRDQVATPPENACRAQYAGASTR